MTNMKSHMSFVT